MKPPLLGYESATVGYSGRPVVEEATLAVASGELVGLVGPNGAGKSTMLRVVTGEADLLRGSVYLGGRPVSAITPRERARFVGVVPQQIGVAFSFPAREFVEMGRHPHLPRLSSPGAADVDAVNRALALTDTEHLADQPVDALSGGDLQRLALAQALAQEPKLLLLDEPTSHLDLNHRLQVLDLVRELTHSGMGAIAVFHDLDMAARYADRIAVVSANRVGPALPPEEVIDAGMLSEVFGVRAVVGTDPVTGTVSVTPVLREGAVSPKRRGSVLVIGGSGVAAPLLRKLVIEGWTVSGGALNAGDADAILAEALQLPYAELPPFAPMDGPAFARVSTLAREADVVVVCEVPFGKGNVENLQAAVESNTPLVLVGGIEGRDYTGGLAEELWSRALAGGATVVRTTADALAALDESADRKRG